MILELLISLIYHIQTWISRDDRFSLGNRTAHRSRLILALVCMYVVVYNPLFDGFHCHAVPLAPRAEVSSAATHQFQNPTWVRSVTLWFSSFVVSPYLNLFYWSDGMQCCRSDWPGLCLCCQPTELIWAFLFHFSNFTPIP